MLRAVVVVVAAAAAGNVAATAAAAARAVAAGPAEQGPGSLGPSVPTAPVGTPGLRPSVGTPG